MHSKSFTLIELIVVASIILLLTALILPNFRRGDKEFALQRAAHKLAQDLRRVEEMAMSVKEFPGAPANFQGGYGIWLQVNSSNYLFFADLDNDKFYDPGEEVDSLELEKTVKISNLSPSSPLTITFTPPDPTVTISHWVPLAVITLSNNGQTKTVSVNQVGLINVE